MRESAIQREIMEALGTEPDLILLRNTVGKAQMVDLDTGKTHYVTFGLGTGSPDLVGILRREINGSHVGQWFCLEIKRPGEELRLEQRKCSQAWRWFGAFVATATSVEEARSALARARKGMLQ